jgi:PHD-finger
VLTGFCSNESVDCAVCKNTYHMDCVRPPLLKKPARGFAWACGPCNRAQERKLQERNTPHVGGDVDEDMLDEEEEEILSPGHNASDSNTPAPSDEDDLASRPATAAQIAHANMWPWRYLGIHCKVEDALDYDDRIHPRAGSRIGPRHQATIPLWPGRPFELIEKPVVKKKWAKGSKGGNLKPVKDVAAMLDSDNKSKRPPWVVDAPTGYVCRGEDLDNDDPKCTATLLFRGPEVLTLMSISDEGKKVVEAKAEEQLKITDEYLPRAEALAGGIGVLKYDTNFLDKAFELLYKNDFHIDPALRQLKLVSNKKDLKNPVLKPEELKRFEDGVQKFGSELQTITKHVKTVKNRDIVRFYYMWKKTENGKRIWGGYEGRKGKKEAKRVDSETAKLVDEVADDMDDSAFDESKAEEKKKGFSCKFCQAQYSRQWRRAPGVAPGTTTTVTVGVKPNGKDKQVQLVLGLCQRCGELWRRYGIKWEDVDEIAKKLNSVAGRAYRRKIDEELLKELVAANELAAINTAPATVAAAVALGANPPQVFSSPVAQPAGQEPPKKKLKGEAKVEKEGNSLANVNTQIAPTPALKKEKKVVEKAAPPPPPEPPKPRILPCAICTKAEPAGEQLLACKECRMSVHRQCYGVITDIRNPAKWTCDTCSNDKTPKSSMVSICSPLYSFSVG